MTNEEKELIELIDAFVQFYIVVPKKDINSYYGFDIKALKILAHYFVNENLPICAAILDYMIKEGFLEEKDGEYVTRKPFSENK